MLPDEATVDWTKTKIHLGLFLSAYKTARERCGLPMLPKVATECFLLVTEVETIVSSERVIRLENKEELLELSQLFIRGYSAIMHPYRSEVTERRRKVFLLRYLYGLSMELISERIHYQKNVIVEESKLAIIQFGQATDLIVLKSKQLPNN